MKNMSIDFIGAAAGANYIRTDNSELSDVQSKIARAVYALAMRPPSDIATDVGGYQMTLQEWIWEREAQP